MRRPVVAGEPGAVHAEDHRQLLQADVVHNGIEGALQKSRVDGADRPEALRGHARGKDHRVLLGDAHVEVALGMMRPEEIESRAVGHGRGDGHDALVLVGQVTSVVGKDLGVGRLPGRLGLARLRIVRPQAVKLLLPIERRLKAAALLRQHVQQHRVGLRS